MYEKQIKERWSAHTFESDYDVERHSSFYFLGLQVMSMLVSRTVLTLGIDTNILDVKTDVYPSD